MICMFPGICPFHPCSKISPKVFRIFLCHCFNTYEICSDFSSLVSDFGGFLFPLPLFSDQSN